MGSNLHIVAAREISIRNGDSLARSGGPSCVIYLENCFWAQTLETAKHWLQVEGVAEVSTDKTERHSFWFEELTNFIQAPISQLLRSNCQTVADRIRDDGEYDSGGLATVQIGGLLEIIRTHPVFFSIPSGVKRKHKERRGREKEIVFLIG